MLIDYIKFSLEGIRKRKLRSYLTMIGIFIGIAAVVSLISLGQGLQNTIEEQFQQLGGDKIIIMPGGANFGTFSSAKLTQNDLEVIEDTTGIDLVTETIFRTTSVYFKDEVQNIFVIGLETDETSSIFTDMSGFEAEKGRWLKNGDKFKVAIGWRHWNEDLFEKSVRLRDKLEVDGIKLEVIGLVKKIGNPQDDAQVYIPIETAREIFDAEDEIDAVYAQVKKGYDPEEVAEEVKDNLRDYRDEDEGAESFSVQTFANILDTFNNIFGIVQAVLVGIAGISLLVGGIGIMNTMYMSVMERTKEIGVMKAIGAKNSHIMKIFLIESGTYGLIGGGIGVLIGVGIAKSVEFAAAQYMGTNLLQASMDPVLIFGALAFAFIVGALSGIAPSYRASKLNPVDALKYE